MKKKFMKAGLGILGLCFFIITIWIILVLADLPDVSVLKRYRPAAASEVLDRDGHILTHYYERKLRIWVPISSLPDVVIRAVVIAEDDTFFGHKGVNYKAVWDALVHDARKGRFARGGSTITQQMIKNVMLSKEKTINRKLREYFLARRAEEILTKHQILEIYMNEVEWGDNLYGIEAASRYYFDKHATELLPAEAALLAGMLPNPRFFNPYKRIEKARDRQERVLFNMFQAKLLTEDEYKTALLSPLNLRNESSGKFDFSAMSNTNGRLCYEKVLEDILLPVYGEHGLYRQGLRIKTTLEKGLQERVAGALSDEYGKTAPSGGVIAVKEGSAIRALVCAPNEDMVRVRLNALGYAGAYEAVEVSPQSIGREDIIAPENTVENTIDGPAAESSSQPGMNNY